MRPLERFFCCDFEGHEMSSAKSLIAILRLYMVASY